MSDESGEKTEEPTPKKLDDARKRGQVWKSRDLTGALVFFVGYAAMTASTQAIYEQFHMLFNNSVEKIGHLGLPEHDTADAHNQNQNAMLILCGPVLFGAAVVG